MRIEVEPTTLYALRHKDGRVLRSYAGRYALLCYFSAKSLYSTKAIARNKLGTIRRAGGARVQVDKGVYVFMQADDFSVIQVKAEACGLPTGGAVRAHQVPGLDHREDHEMTELQKLKAKVRECAGAGALWDWLESEGLVICRVVPDCQHHRPYEPARLRPEETIAAALGIDYDKLADEREAAVRAVTGG